MQPLALRLSGERLDGQIPRGLESLGAGRRPGDVSLERPAPTYMLGLTRKRPDLRIRLYRTTLHCLGASVGAGALVCDLYRLF
jgi:hypothetical protein